MIIANLRGPKGDPGEKGDRGEPPVIKLTQAAFDLIENPDPETMYFITE